MTYLDRLKRKIGEDVPRGEATKGTKAPYVPFVAPLPAPSRQISPEQAANEVTPELYVDTKELRHIVAVFHKAAGDTDAVIGECVRDALERPELALRCYRELMRMRRDGEQVH